MDKILRIPDFLTPKIQKKESPANKIAWANLSICKYPT